MARIRKITFLKWRRWFEFLCLIFLLIFHLDGIPVLSLNNSSKTPPNQGPMRDGYRYEIENLLGRFNGLNSIFNNYILLERNVNTKKTNCLELMRLFFKNYLYINLRKFLTIVIWKLHEG